MSYKVSYRHRLFCKTWLLALRRSTILIQVKFVSNNRYFSYIYFMFQRKIVKEMTDILELDRCHMVEKIKSILLHKR